MILLEGWVKKVLSGDGMRRDVLFRLGGIKPEIKDLLEKLID